MIMDTYIMPILVIIAFLIGHKLGRDSKLITEQDIKTIKSLIPRPKTKILSTLQAKPTQEEKTIKELEKQLNA